MTHRRLLVLILVAYLALASVYSIVTPLFEASDELWHVPMVKYLADNSLRLPSPDPAQAWRQEGGQPPLYYVLAAILTGGMNTSALDTVRRVNPHADIGVVRPDGNANMIVHRADAEAFPWRGAALAVHVARLLSVALGACTVLVTYLLAREVFPDNEVVALGAAALNAFLPMFLFISGSVNNDNLSNLLGSLLTLLIARLLKARRLPGWRTYAALGVVAGAALLAKLNLGFLIPLAALALLVVSLRLRDWRPLVVGGLVSGALAAAVAGWWYWRNWQLYGDPTGLNVFLDTVGRRLVPANLAQLWAERHSFTQAFWGFFGGMNVPLPDTVYLTFNIIGGLALASAVVFVVVRALALHSRLLSHALGSGEEGKPHWLPALVTIAWIAITFVSYLRWTAETPASQGRLVFGALSSICLWMAVGLTWWLPKRLQPVMMGGAAGYFALVAALAPFLVIAPAYAPPESAAAGAARAAFAAENDGGLLNLLDARVLTETIQPDEYVEIVTEWRVAQPLSRDWSLFVHLTTPGGVIIAQRDVYPGMGRLATSDLRAGYAWRNPVAVRVPPAAYAPVTLDVNVGWYHLPTGERLKLSDGAETVMIGQVELLPRETTLDVPNPVSINFDNQIELVGYRLSSLTPRAGDALELTLYWRALQPLTTNYTVFVHVIDPRAFTIYAGSDSQPAGGSAPTTTWQPGDIIEDAHTLTLREDTPPDIYELELGWYPQTPDGGFERLRIVTADGGMADNFVYLTRVRTLPLETEPDETPSAS